MKPYRGKIIVLIAGLVGLAVLTIAGFAFKDRIKAEYYLSRLGEEDNTPRIMVWYGRASSVYPDNPPKRIIEMVDWQEVEFYGKTLWAEAMVELGKSAVPALIRGLESTDPQVQIRAVWALGTIGPDAAKAIPALSKLESLKTPVGRIKERTLSQIACLSAAESLKRVRGEEQTP